MQFDLNNYNKNSIFFKIFHVFIIIKCQMKKGMVFKPDFKCFKNEKIIFIQVILKLECLLYQNIYIISLIRIYIYYFIN